MRSYGKETRVSSVGVNSRSGSLHRSSDLWRRGVFTSSPTQPGTRSDHLAEETLHNHVCTLLSFTMQPPRATNTFPTLSSDLYLAACKSRAER